MPARILVIDDDAVACEFLQEALSRAGYEVEALTSAKEALHGDLAVFDLLMSDIRMPGIDGLQFLRQVHEKWPELPVILMTAYGSLETTMEALRLGAWDYISKPFSPDQIRAMVKKVLEVRELQQRRMRGQPSALQAPEFIGSSPAWRGWWEPTHWWWRQDGRAPCPPWWPDWWRLRSSACLSPPATAWEAEGRRLYIPCSSPAPF